MNKIIVKEKEYHLADETFDTLSRASAKLLSGDGALNYAEAGKIIFDSLYLGNQGDLDKVQKDVHLYFNLCLKASKIVEFFEGELKKN